MRKGSQPMRNALTKSSLETWLIPLKALTQELWKTDFASVVREILKDWENREFKKDGISQDDDENNFLKRF